MSEEENPLVKNQKIQQTEGTKTRKGMKDFLRKKFFPASMVVISVFAVVVGGSLIKSYFSDGEAPIGYNTATTGQSSVYKVGKGQTLRLREVSGKITLENQDSNQCMDPRPAVPYTVHEASDGFVVTEKDTGNIIYVMSWSSDAVEYYLDIEEGRTATITVYTNPVGTKDCRKIWS